MIDHREYRVRVNRYLDEHRDPLEDPQVVAFLDAHPQHLLAFAEERADLEHVAALPQAATSGASPKRPWLYAAAAVVLFSLAWAWSNSDGGVGNGHSSDDSAQMHANGERTERPSRILSATLHEVEPTVRPAAFYTVRAPLVRTAKLTLEAYEQRSELR